jgi:methyl-accepting chemotaxis protein
VEGIYVLKSLKGKLIFPIAAVFLLTVLVIIIYVSSATRSLAEDLTQEQLLISSNAVSAKLDEIKARSELIAYAVASNYNVINSIINWNEGNQDQARQDLIAYLSTTARDMGVDSFIVRDAEGVVVLRLHDINNFGTPDNSASGIAAMQGRTTTGYSSTATMAMGLNTTAPVWHNGEVIGNIAPLSFLHTNQFVDHFAGIFNAHITVFGGQGGNNRVATTFGRETGQRAVGTTLENQAILEPVLGRGVPHNMQTELFGEVYNVFYYPLMNINNAPVGMFFIGFSVDAVESAITTKQITLVVIGVIALIIASGIMFILITWLLKPLDSLTKSVKAVSAGNFNINVDRQNVSRDEIGAISLDVYSMVDVIRAIVDEVQKLIHMMGKEGEIEYRIDVEKYQGGFREMVSGLNTYTDEYVNEILTILSLLSDVNKGIFKSNLKTLPGKKIVMNQTVDSLIANLTGVSTEINGMIDAAAVKGNLKFNIDTTKYQGDWRTIMSGLNNVAEAVDKPLEDIKNAMDSLRKGRFDTLVNGNYAGDFLSIKNDINDVIKGMAGYVREIGSCLSEVANGDLTRHIRMDFDGEFNQIKISIENIVNTLHKTMADINSASSQVLMGAKQISASAINLANGAQQQASSIEELNASIDLINQQTQLNAENAGQASELSRKSTENANAGNESMKHMLEAMEKIKESSNDISKIIKSIQDITFQTNLLSLNASVEAARAGEHGRGFAVVADEVRNLANKSQQSTVETTALIGDSINRVDAGSSIAHETSESLAVIVKNASEVLEIINGISTSSKEQAESISQVSIGLAQISTVVQSNSAVSEETAAASQELNSQAEVLQQLVAYFRL